MDGAPERLGLGGRKAGGGKTRAYFAAFEASLLQSDKLTHCREGRCVGSKIEV
jgi:hypothetical protein